MDQLKFNKKGEELIFEGFDAENNMEVSIEDANYEYLYFYLTIEETKQLSEYLNKALLSLSNYIK